MKRSQPTMDEILEAPNFPFSLPQSPRGLISLPFVRRLSPPTAPSNYSSPNWKIRLAVNFADSRSGSSTSTTNSITSPQNEELKILAIHPDAHRFRHVPTSNLRFAFSRIDCL